MAELFGLTQNPIVVVARGTLSPKYLRWVREYWDDSQIYVVNFSRWRYFDGVEESACRWVTTPIQGPATVVVFDRSVTTGLTYKYLDQWFQKQGIKTINLGEVDAERCKFGMRWVDYVWDNGEVTPKKQWLKHHKEELGGEYTIVVFGGWRPELNRFTIHTYPCDDTNKDFSSIVEDLERDAPGNVIIRSFSDSIDSAMLRAYLLERPLITVSASEDIPADFSAGESLDVLVDYLQKEHVT